MQKFNKASYGDLIADALSQVLTTVIKRVVVDRGIRYARAKFDDRFNIPEIDDAIEDEEVEEEKKTPKSAADFGLEDFIVKKDYQTQNLLDVSKLEKEAANIDTQKFEELFSELKKIDNKKKINDKKRRQSK